MTKILLVHGINNEDKTQQQIKAEWSQAIKDGFEQAGLEFTADVSFAAAYYADRLHEATTSWGQDVDEVVTPMSAQSADDDYVSDEVAALFTEYQKRYDISDLEVQQELDEDDDMGSVTRMAKGIHKKWLKALARVLEQVIPTRGRYIAKAFLRQAAAYLHKPGLKEEIDALVKAQLFANLQEDDEVIIISHSLGTVVTYALLRMLRRHFKVKLLITAGSPLGIEIVKRKLGPPLVCLPDVQKWLNVADEEDFVALYPELNRSTFGCNQIVNIVDVDNGYEDAHDIRQYLKHPSVAREIAARL